MKTFTRISQLIAKVVLFSAMSVYQVSHAEGLTVLDLNPPIDATILANDCVGRLPNFPVKQGAYFNGEHIFESTTIPSAEILKDGITNLREWAGLGYNVSYVDTCLATNGDGLALVQTTNGNQIHQGYVLIPDYKNQGLSATTNSLIAAGAINGYNEIKSVIMTFMPSNTVPNVINALINGITFTLIQ